MKLIFQKLLKHGMDRRFGYKVATPHGDICIFRHQGGGIWENLAMNPPHPYLESEAVTVLDHCAKTGTFKVFTCCCMACKGAVTDAMLKEFERNYGEPVTHSYWPACAAAEHARFEA